MMVFPTLMGMQIGMGKGRKLFPLQRYEESCGHDLV
ncbi:hypothetical protein AVEN_151181-1, partial [Araneus ventricosus]